MACHWQNILQLLETIFSQEGRLFFTKNKVITTEINARTGKVPNILQSQCYNLFRHRIWMRAENTEWNITKKQDIQKVSRYHAQITNYKRRKTSFHYGEILVVITSTRWSTLHLWQEDKPKLCACWCDATVRMNPEVFVTKRFKIRKEQSDKPRK